MRAYKITYWGRRGLALLALLVLLIVFHDSLPSPLGDLGRYVLDTLNDFVTWTGRAFRLNAAGS